MSIAHASAGDVIDVRPLAEQLPETRTHTLLKTADMEVIRLVLPAGKVIPGHRAPGEITVHCLEGEVAFTAYGKTQTLPAGRMLYLSSAATHALEAVQDSSVLVTIILGDRK